MPQMPKRKHGGEMQRENIKLQKTWKEDGNFKTVVHRGRERKQHG